MSKVIRGIKYGLANCTICNKEFYLKRVSVGFKFCSKECFKDWENSMNEMHVRVHPKSDENIFDSAEHYSQFRMGDW